MAALPHHVCSRKGQSRRLNWIHPFVEGNGRTARAACYYLLCMKQGRLLAGRKTVPERIRENRQPYYAALKAADRAWDAGHIDVSVMSNYLEELLLAQLTEYSNPAN
ncbi:MAG TPA: Fic family protein [Candidatus Angelobacter sp.]